MADDFLNEDFRDLLRAFTDAEVRFLVVGAYALAVHARPRATGDLDILVEPTAANAARTLSGLRAFGAPLQDLTEADLAAPGTVFQIGVVPRRIDILTAVDGVTFSEAWAGHVEAAYGDVRFPVIGIDALITNKRATGRPQDLVDVEVLERARGLR